MDEYWQDNCYYHLAVKAEDYKLCANILEVSRNIGCVKKIAIDTNNVELCEERLYWKIGLNASIR